MNSHRKSAAIRSRLQRARARMPEPTAGLIRELTLLWGRMTASARMEPSFIVVGAQRAGTTTMFRLLAEHPDLVRPTLSKGSSYFDDEFDHGPRWYRAHFPLALTGWFQTGSLHRAQTFECSGYYMFHPHAAERIAAALPNVRLIALVRDPAERAYSAHRHECRRGFDHHKFGMAIALEPERTEFETHRLENEPGYRSFAHRHHAYLARGRYAEQLDRLVGAVGADRVLVIDADAFFADPVEEFLKLQEWLGLRPWTPDDVPVWNAAPRDPLPAAARAELMEYFEGPDADLARYLGHPPSWRVPSAATTVRSS